MQEEDTVAVRTIGTIAAVALAVVAAGVAAAWLLLREHPGTGAAELPDGHAQERVVNLLQTELGPRRAPPAIPTTPESLTGFAWVDRARGEVRIPIEDAMQLVATGRAP